MTHWLAQLTVAQRTGVVYGSILAGWLFGLELPAHFGLIPILTLSGDIWSAIKWWHPVAIFVAFFLFVLTGHLDRGWSVLYLIGAALLIAAAVAIHIAS